MTKTELFELFELELESNSKEDLLEYIFDWFNTTELEELLNHIKNENGN